MFKYGKEREGYWNADHMQEQADEFADAVKCKYPRKTHVFTFDHSCGHDKMPENALNASIMNVVFGGDGENSKRVRNMRDIVLHQDYPNSNLKMIEMNGESRHLKKGDRIPVCFQEKTHAGKPPSCWYKPGVPPHELEGKPKGLKQLLWELGLFKEGMTLLGGEDREFGLSMRQVLAAIPSFRRQKPALFEHLAKEGIGADATPKYHCELVAIERRWARSKWWLRHKCQYRFSVMEQNIPLSMFHPDIQPDDMVRRFFRKARDYKRAYRERKEKTAGAARLLVKKYKSHRAPPPSEAHKKLYKPWEKKKAANKAAANELSLSIKARDPVFYRGYHDLFRIGADSSGDEPNESNLSTSSDWVFFDSDTRRFGKICEKAVADGKIQYCEIKRRRGKKVFGIPLTIFQKGVEKKIIKWMGKGNKWVKRAREIFRMNETSKD